MKSVPRQIRPPPATKNRCEKIVRPAYDPRAPPTQCKYKAKPGKKFCGMHLDE